MRLPLHESIFGLIAYKLGKIRFKANIPAVSTFRAKYTSANMGGEEGLEDMADESNTMSLPPSGAEINGIVKPDDVEFFVPQKHPDPMVPVLLLGGDTMLVD